MKQGKIILAEITRPVIIEPDNSTEIVIFPKGLHHIIAGDENDKPVEMDVTVDKTAYEKIKAVLFATNADLSEMWSDFNHMREAASSWLQDIVWDEEKGIVAKVKLTEQGLNAIKGQMYKFFSPTFFVDDNNNIIALDECFGAMTNIPAFENIKQYPIKAQKQDKTMNDKIETKEEPKAETVIQAEIPVEMKAETVCEDHKEPDGDEQKQDVKAESPADEKKEDQKPAEKKEDEVKAEDQKPEEKKEDKVDASQYLQYSQLLTTEFAKFKTELPDVIGKIFAACFDKMKAEKVEAEKQVSAVTPVKDERKPRTELLATVVKAESKENAEFGNSDQRENRLKVLAEIKKSNPQMDELQVWEEAKSLHPKYFFNSIS